jgi:hypothetical protein
MLRGVFISLCALLPVGGTAVGFAAPAPPPGLTQSEQSRVDAPEIDREVRQRIRELADNSYQVRESAQRRLVEIGESARAAVKAGLDDADPEVRARCRRIAEALDIEAKQAARRRLEAQLDQFIADAGSDRRYDFPGWDRFRESVGNDQGSRQLFAELFRRELDVMSAVAATTSEAQELLERRSQDLQSRMRGPARTREPIGWQSAVALAWLASRTDLEARPIDSSLLYSILVRSDLSQGLRDERQAPAIRNTLGAWIARDASPDDATNQYKLQLASIYQVRQGLQLAAKLLTERRGTLPPATVSQCVQVFSKLGGKEEFPLLESLLDDKTVCLTVRAGNETFQTQVRDIALATLVEMSGQDPREYGFTRLSRTRTATTTPQMLGFTTAQEAQREQGVKKWRAYRERSGKN